MRDDQNDVGVTHTHEYTHTHPHDHAHDHHSHDHGDTHEHKHTYTHTHEGGEQPHTHEIPEHDHCSSDCAACSGCPSPRDELTALMKYMVGHNAAHANELAQLAKQLDEAGEHTAYEQVMLAVSDFEKGNLRLSAVLTSMEK